MKKYLISVFFLIVLCGVSLASDLPFDQPVLIPGTITSTSVDFSWTDNADGEEGLILEQETGPNWGAWENPVIFDIGANKTSYTDNTVVILLFSICSKSFVL